MTSSIGSYTLINQRGDTDAWYCRDRHVLVRTSRDGVVYVLDCLSGRPIRGDDLASAIQPFTTARYVTPETSPRFRWLSRFDVIDSIVADLIARGRTRVVGRVHTVEVRTRSSAMYMSGGTRDRVADGDQILGSAEGTSAYLRGILARLWARDVAGDDYLREYCSDTSPVVVDPVMMDAYVGRRMVSWLRPELLRGEQAAVLGVTSALTGSDARRAIEAVVAHTRPAVSPEPAASPVRSPTPEPRLRWDPDGMAVVYKRLPPQTGEWRHRVFQFGKNYAPRALIDEFSKLGEFGRVYRDRPLVVGRGSLAWGFYGLYQIPSGRTEWVKTTPIGGDGPAGALAVDIAMRWWARDVAGDRRLDMRWMLTPSGVEIVVDPVLGEVAWTSDGESWDFVLLRDVPDDPMWNVGDDSPVVELARVLGDYLGVVIYRKGRIDARKLFRAVFLSPPDGEVPWRHWRAEDENLPDEESTDMNTETTEHSESEISPPDDAEPGDRPELNVRCDGATYAAVIAANSSTDPVATRDRIIRLRTVLLALVWDIESWFDNPRRSWDAIDSIRTGVVRGCDEAWAIWRGDDIPGTTARFVFDELEAARDALNRTFLKYSECHTEYRVKAIVQARRSIRAAEDRIWRDVIAERDLDVERS